MHPAINDAQLSRNVPALRLVTSCSSFLPSLLLLFFLCVLCVPTARGQVQAQTKALSATDPAAHSLPAEGSDENQPLLKHRESRYRLYPSDQIAITFPLTPEFDQTATLEPDGYVSLAGAGDVLLAGKTTQEAAVAIKTAYGKILHDPIVTVELKNFNGPFFVVTGQVNHPGRYDLRGPTPATEAIAIAGGMTQAAKSSQVLLFRKKDGGGYGVSRIDLKRIFDGQQQEYRNLVSGDMLYVPKSVISRIERFIPSSGFGAYYQLHP